MAHFVCGVPILYPTTFLIVVIPRVGGKDVNVGALLRRCDVCKRFHASYLVERGEGDLHLCADCWRALYAPKLPTDADPGGTRTDKRRPPERRRPR